MWCRTIWRNLGTIPKGRSLSLSRSHTYTYRIHGSLLAGYPIKFRLVYVYIYTERERPGRAEKINHKRRDFSASPEQEARIPLAITHVRVLGIPAQFGYVAIIAIIAGEREIVALDAYYVLKIILIRATAICVQVTIEIIVATFLFPLGRTFHFCHGFVFFSFRLRVLNFFAVL